MAGGVGGMTFLFFDAADQVLFSRNDAEQAEYNHQEMSLYALFPYDSEKVITAGMRIGYTDNLGVFQVFEVITPKSYEPDHYQEITAEHICISELTDEIYTAGDLMEMTAAEALEALLDGTLWDVGTSTASNESSAKFSFGDVWSDVRSIEQNWNVYITPRITYDSTGITGRYLDIRPAEPIWRGLRFSLEKNLDDASVTWDTSRLKTALYGYGKKSMSVEGESEKQPWTFANVTWAAEDGHPAKPNGQIYLEDPAATAAYGRNGRARFGYYQNGDIDDPELLLELTWKTLQTVNAPDVTIDGQVRDITKFGEVDVPIRLHDSAQIEITPIGTLLVREVVQYTENLLQPENSRVTIGKYIPNIVYITKDIASGGGGGGSGGQSDEEYKISEFETEITANSYEINLRAYQRDMTRVEEILRQAGIALDAQGVIVYADDNVNMWQSKLNVQADRIGLVVQGSGSNAYIKAAEIVAAVNSAGSSVSINADKITLNGQTLVQEISGIEADFTNLTAGNTTATELKATMLDAVSSLNFAGTLIRWTTIGIGSVVSYSGLSSAQSAIDLDHSHAITMTESSGVVTATLGAAVTTSSADRTANFNIADTAFYQNAVSAARSAGGVLTGPNWSPTITDDNNTYTITSAGGGSISQRMTLTRQSSWISGSRYVYMNADGNQKARILMSLPATADSWSYNSATNVVTCTVCGKSYTYSI